MKSDVFLINSDAGRIAAARYATENFAWHAKLDKRSALRLDLLVEETLGMMRVMVDDFYGRLWFVGDDKACEIHLEATANIDSDKKQELLSMSSSGRNASAKGFMAMLGDVISGALHNIGGAMNEAYGPNAVALGYVPQAGMGTPSVYDMTPLWTLEQYKTSLEQGKLSDDALENAKNDLEKSIVANLADDIVVGVKGDRIELVITKRFDTDK